MAIIKSGLSLLENGMKHRTVLKGKALETIPEIGAMCKNYERPELHIGINGRGKDGATYGVKLIDRDICGDTTEFALSGRIDYRENSPILQIRGTYLTNENYSNITGNLTIRTDKTPDLNLQMKQDDYKISVKSDSDNVRGDFEAEWEAIESLNKLLKTLGININLKRDANSAFDNIESFNKKLAKKLNEINPFGQKNNNHDVNAQKAIKSINVPKDNEIKINPYDYFKEDAPDLDLNKTEKPQISNFERPQLIQNKKQQIAQIDLNIKMLEHRLTEAEKEFKEAKAGGDAISKASKIKIIKEQIEHTKLTKSLYERELANLEE